MLWTCANSFKMQPWVPSGITATMIQWVWQIFWRVQKRSKRHERLFIHQSQWRAQWAHINLCQICLCFQTTQSRPTSGAHDSGKRHSRIPRWCCDQDVWSPSNQSDHRHRHLHWGCIIHGHEHQEVLCRDSTGSLWICRDLYQHGSWQDYGRILHIWPRTQWIPVRCSSEKVCKNCPRQDSLPST
jgi:hypothetical protein